MNVLDKQRNGMYNENRTNVRDICVTGGLMKEQSIDVYENLPVLESDHFLLRGVQMEDCEDLLAVYSDPQAWPFFNADNCNGDLFHYDTLEKMKQAIGFWLMSYRERWFVRWSIIDKACNKAVGTVECFQREANDSFNHEGVLRLDLQSSYETELVIEELVAVLLVHVYDLFDCDRVITKVVPEAHQRLAAVSKLGFHPANECLIGHDGTAYGNYYEISRNSATVS